jgi:hypothetical protein
MEELNLEETMRSHYARHLTAEAGAGSVLERKRCEAARQALELLSLEMGISLAGVKPAPQVPMPPSPMRLAVLAVELTCDCGFSGKVRVTSEATASGLFGVRCQQCERTQCVSILESYERNPATFEPGHYVSFMLSLAPPEWTPSQSPEPDEPRPAA